MIGVGESIWNTRGAPLTVTGGNPPPAAAIIHATLVYGALGTCQGGALKLAQSPQIGYHGDLWKLAIGQGAAQFAGIVEQATPPIGSELSEVKLIAPHRATLDALGAQIGSPYSLQTFGVVVAGVEATARLSDVLAGILEPYPTADYGVGPELIAGIGIPDYATLAHLNAGDALRVRSLGYAPADYTTDALFDPGDNWEKRTYARAAPDLIPRRTAAATAIPAILAQREGLFWAYQEIPQGEWGVRTLAHTVYADGVQREYNGTTGLATVNPLYQVARYVASLPANTPTRRNRTVSAAVPFTLTALNVMDPEKGTEFPDVIVQLKHGSGAIGSYTQTLKPAHIGLQMVASFEVPADVIAAGGALTVEILLRNQNTNYQAVLIFHPITATLEYETPNYAGVVMPPGWGAPFATGPIYELVFRGWHKPPFMVNGLPVGSQLAAGSSVAWDKNTCETTVTTMAWPYAGERRR